MTHAERKALRDKHKPIEWHGIKICDSCDREFACDAIKLLDYLDIVDPMPSEVNWQAGK